MVEMQVDPVNQQVLSTRTRVEQAGTAVSCCAAIPHLPNGSLSGHGNNLILAIDNQQYTLSGHSKAVRGCAVASTGEWAVSCSQDRTLCIWDLTQRALTPALTLEGHSDKVESCAITANDQFIVSGSWDKRVLLWDATAIANQLRSPVADYEAPHALLGEHAHFLNHVASFPACQAVLSSSADTTVKMLKLPMGSLQRFREMTEDQGKAHTDLICGMAHDPSHQAIITASWDRTVALLDTESGEILTRWLNHSKRVNDVKVARSGAFAATASMDHTVILWDLPLRVARRTLKGHKGHVMSVAISHDEMYVASGSADRTIIFWNRQTGSRIETVEAHTSWVTSLEFSQRSRLLASASVDGEAKVWRTVDGVPLAHLKGHTAPILDIRWTPNDEYLITCSEDWSIGVWRVGTWECVQRIRGHLHEVTASAVLDREKDLCDLFQCPTLLATSSSDQTIRFWNYMTGELLWLFYGENAFMYLLYLGSRRFAAGDSRGGLHLLSLQN